MSGDGKGAELLLVDGDPAFLERLADHLARIGFSIRTTTSPREGIAVLDEAPVDCVVSGYDLREMDGVEFLEAVRAEHSELPFVLFTGISSEEIAIAALEAGADAYLRKGEDADQFAELADRVGTLVERTPEVTERERRERALTALNDVAVDFDSRETVEGVCERTVAASEEILEFDLSVIDLEENGYLSKAAISEEVPEADATTMSVEEGIAGKTYRTGESFLIDDLADYPEAEPQGPYESAISIPVGEHGVFQAIAEEPAAFDETDLELAELLVSHATSALDRLEREQQVRRQKERLEEVARIIAHDLRNPIAVIEGRLELAREECDSEHLADIADAVDRMGTIVEDTLTLAREGRLVDERTELDLGEFAGECWGTVATEAATLEVVDGGTIRADPDRLRHVFENLFRNAVEHAGDDVTVRVGTTDGGFYVEDDGPGIPADERETVFEPGHSEDGTTGFGLAIVRQIAEAHGWTVDVTDGSLGGARFEFAAVSGPVR